MFPLSASAPAADSMDQHTTMISSPTSNAASGDATPPEPPLCVCMVAAMPFPTSNGTSGSVREMAEALAGRGHEVHVVTYHFGQDIPVRGVHLHPRHHAPRQGIVDRCRAHGPQTALRLADHLQDLGGHSPLPAGLTWRTATVCLCGGICRLLTASRSLGGHNSMADELPLQALGPRWRPRPWGGCWTDRVAVSRSPPSA